MTSNTIPENKRALYQKLVDLNPDIELKGASKLTYTSVNGHMFSQMTKDGRLGMRLSKEDQKAFIENYSAIPFKNYGANIKDYVEVPAGMLETPEALSTYLAKSLAYTLTLKPK